MSPIAAPSVSAPPRSPRPWRPTPRRRSDMPEPFVKTTSRVISIPRANIDTDQICPARFLKIKGNALKNALLPIAVSAERLAALQALVAANPDGEWTVDLDALTVTLSGGDSFAFEIDPFARAMILAGTDEIGYVRSRLPEIEAWEATHAARVETRSGAGAAR